MEIDEYGVKRMNAVSVRERDQGRFGPYIAAIPFAMILFGFYGAFLPFGFLGIAGFSLTGLLWALFLGFIADRLMRREGRRELLANATVFASIIAAGLLAGAGLMYRSMMLEVLEEPTTTYAVLSALMQPAVPYYILINTLLELFIMLLVVFFNWNAGRTRRILSLGGVGLYLAMRIWTYLVYAENRLDISARTLSGADVDWFNSTLVADYRPILVLITAAVFTLAAFAPFRSTGDRESGEHAAREAN
jgi:hypothetical protein